MLRILAIFGLGLLALGGAEAGTLTPLNLTTSSVGVGTCSTAGCTPTVSSFGTGTYLNTLLTTYILPSPPSPSSSPQYATTGSGTTPFIIAAQSGGNDSFVSASATNQDTSIVVDLGTCTGATPSPTCGAFSVEDVYTMIQANGEAYGFQGVTVTLSGYAVGGSAITDTVDLTAGVDYRGTKSNSTVICTDANSVTSSCAGANSDTAQVFGTDSSPGGTPGNTVVTYNNVYGGQTSGIRNYYLDAQELELGGIFAGAYLDSVTITNDSPSGGDGTILFSGLTLNQDSPVVPEPSTIALLGIGLSLGAFLKIRSRRASACQQSVG